VAAGRKPLAPKWRAVHSNRGWRNADGYAKLAELVCGNVRIDREGALGASDRLLARDDGDL
jgi:hypothetical protein